MYIILNYWYDEGIENAQPVLEPETGKNMTFETREKAIQYAEEELNGYFKIVEG